MTRRLKVIGGLVVLVGLLSATAALATWSSTVSGSAVARSGDFAGGGGATPTASGRSVVVTWPRATMTDGSAVDGYRVQRYAGDGAAATVTTACDGLVPEPTDPPSEAHATASCTERNVPEGLWRYTVIPVKGTWTGAESPATGGVSIPPPAPMNVRATASTRTSLTIAWDSASTTATEYRVERLGAGGAWQPVATVDAPTLSTNEVSLACGTAYSYRVVAFSQSTDLASDPSATAVLSTASCAAPSFLVELVQASSKTAGTAFNVRLTARTDGVTDTSYAGQKAVTFSGPGASPNGTAPSYGSNPVTVNFSGGIGTTSLTLYRAETVVLAAAAGSTRSGGVSVTVAAGAAFLSFVPATGSNACADTAIGLPQKGTWSGRVAVSIVDSWANPRPHRSSSLTVSLSRPANGAVSPSTLTIAPEPATQTGGTLTYTADQGNNKPGTVTATTTDGTLAASCHFTT